MSEGTKKRPDKYYFTITHTLCLRYVFAVLFATKDARQLSGSHLRMCVIMKGVRIVRSNNYQCTVTYSVYPVKIEIIGNKRMKLERARARPFPEFHIFLHRAKILKSIIMYSIFYFCINSRVYCKMSVMILIPLVMLWLSLLQITWLRHRYQ